MERVVRLGRDSTTSVLIFVAASRLLNSPSPKSSFLDVDVVFDLLIFLSILLIATGSGSGSDSTAATLRVVFRA